MGGRGRHTKLTAEREHQLLEALRGGMTRVGAADLSGIGTSTLWDWLRRGATGEEPHKTFREHVLRAEAEAEQMMIHLVMAQKPEFILGRRFKRWDKQRAQDQTITHQNPDGTALRAVDDAKLAALLEALGAHE